jgi:hypothetical protein
MKKIQPMKTQTKLALLALTIIAIDSCKKEDNLGGPPEPSYSSVQSFLTANAPKMQTYTITASSGGSFTSPQGTQVHIPANAFVTQSGTQVTGEVTIQFMDLYKKSDMLFAQKLPVTYNMKLLKSGGEFYIKASIGSTAVLMAVGKKITVSQPTALTGTINSMNAMDAFVDIDTVISGGPGATVNTSGWGPSPEDSVITSANNYVYNLYSFSTPADSGTWCNSDNSTYFDAYTQTSLDLVPDDSVAAYNTSLYLIFTNVNSMVHVYYLQFLNTFSYGYAPVGLQCTAVAIGFKNGVLYSAFVPITISANQTVHFSLHATTSSSFKSQLDALN